MSEKKEWTRAEVLNLISSYEQHHCLWNVLSKDYKNRIKKMEAIKQLSEIFIVSTEEVTRKLHNLRNQFNTELKKMNFKKSGQGSDDNYVSKWPFFKSLLFIKTSLQTRQTIGNVSTEEVDVSEGEDVSSEKLETADEGKARSEFLKRKLPKNSNQVLMKMKKTDDREQLLAKARDALSNDEYDTFGSFVAGELRGLHNECLKRKLKWAIQTLILEITGEDEEMNSPFQLSHLHSSSTQPAAAYSMYNNEYTQL